MQLVRFENAPVHLSPFNIAQYFGTTDFLWDSLRTFYAAQLKGQAMRILGTAGGISELLTEGSVGGFVAGLAHGVTNSAAKFTSSLSEGVGKITMDEQHQELRESLRMVRYRGDAIGHVLSGFKGLGIGILGGTTSIFAQSYQGAKSGFGV
jgi:vacuolar protein sorting-associated protein 13D